MEQNENNAGAIRVDVRNAAIIAFAAFAVRLAYLVGFAHSPFYGYFFLDPKWHDEWAREIAAGDWVGSGVFFRAPLYSYFLGAIYKLTGGGLSAPRIAQFILGSISSALVFLIGLKLFEKRVYAVAAGIAAALYGPMIYFEGELLAPVLTVFFNLSGLLFFYKARDNSKSGAWIASGLCFGLSAITRPDVLVPAFGLSALILIENWRDGARKAARVFLLFSVSTILFPMIVTVRNGLVGGDYVFIASQGGVNFYIGNNPDADGKTSLTPGNFYLAPSDKYRDSVWVSGVVLAESASGRKLKQSEISAFWYSRAFEWIKSNPSQAAALYVRKIFYLLSGHEIPCNNVPLFARNYSTALKALMWDRYLSFPGGVVIPLGILGMILASRQRKLWAPLGTYVILYSAVVVAFFVVARYKMPIMPPLILFSMLAIKNVSESIRNGRRLKPAIALVSLAILATISNINAFGVKNDYIARPLINVGNYYNDLGRYDLAAKYYSETLKYYPEHYMALENLAILEMKAGRYESAEALFRRALKQLPTDPELHYGLGAALEHKGDLSGAEIEYKTALSIDPNYELAKRNLERTRRSLGGVGER